MDDRTGNPRIGMLLQGITGLEVLVLLGAGGGLTLLPAVISEIWPWELTPFNASLLGAVYFASMMTAALLVLMGRWSPARVALPLILLFTTIVLVLSVVYFDQFRRTPSTLLWFVLYIVIPLNAAYHMWLYRGLPKPGGQLGPTLRRLLQVEGVVFGLYGLALLIAPEPSGAFWPWHLDAFHGRFYSVAFLTPALGALYLAGSAAWAEVLALAMTFFVGGLLPIVGLVVTDARVHRIDWSAPGTWLWIAMFAVLAATGAGLWRALRALPRPAGPWNEAAIVVPMRPFALFLGVAFILAGVGGFTPAVTQAVPAGAPALIVPAWYVQLLGIFPVNVLHSLFHLTLGILGVLAFARPALTRPYIRGFALALTLLTVMGTLPLLNITFGLAPLYSHDVWLHGVEAVAAGYVGFFMPDGGSS